MKVIDLKRSIDRLPDDMEVFVGCQGYSNYDFRNGRRYEDGDTLTTVHKGRLFILDECALEDENGVTI